MIHRQTHIQTQFQIDEKALIKASALKSQQKRRFQYPKLFRPILFSAKSSGSPPVFFKPKLIEIKTFVFLRNLMRLPWIDIKASFFSSAWVPAAIEQRTWTIDHDG